MNEPSRPYQIRHSQGMNHESELLTDSCMVGILYLVAVARLELRLSPIG